ncbi:MAG: hypothetical protein PHP54_04290 [Clostridia bacterium]|nr:hypothetical protein [Clostridia bacterium]
MERRYIIYGVPGLLFVTRKAVKAFKLDYHTKEIRIEQITHDIAMVDTAIYIINQHGVDMDDITTEREIKHSNGFGNSKHDPDFIYMENNKKYFVEIELTEKSINRLQTNIQNNFLLCDIQKFVVPSDKARILVNLEKLKQSYPIEVIRLEEVENYVKEL